MMEKQIIFLFFFIAIIRGNDSDFDFTTDDSGNEEDNENIWDGLIESEEEMAAHKLELLPGVKSGLRLIIDGSYIMLANTQSVCGSIHYWECRHRKIGCRHRLTTEVAEPNTDPSKEEHTVIWMLSLNLHTCGQDEVNYS